MQLMMLVVGLVIGGVLGALAAALVHSRRAKSGAIGESPQLVEARHEVELARVRAAEAEVQSALRSELASVEATVEGLRGQIQAAAQQYRELTERHRDEQQSREGREAAESKVLQALAPVRESLGQMQTKVSDLEKQRSTQHGELSAQLRSAVESEERLRTTAESLASALRSNSTRGVWGETQLRSVVEAAGLIDRVDFSTQSSISSDSGEGRPDMVVHLPGGKNIAVDAKVPFSAYLEASQIPITASGPESARRDELLAQHVKAVRAHVTALGSKAYWNGIGNSPELVICFIPSESLVSSALETDPSIMEFAFEKRVALASPVTLWSVLKTVAFSWQQNVLTDQAKLLFDSSRELYSRIATTAEHIEKLGRTIERTVKDYNTFVGSLEGRVLPTARKLAALDETKVLGPLHPVDETPRPLTAYELVSRETAELDAELAQELDVTDRD